MKKVFEIRGRAYTFECEAEYDVEMRLDREEAGVSFFVLDFDFGDFVVPKKISLSYVIDAIDIYSMWDPITRVRNLGIRWGKTETNSRLAGGMPLKQLISKAGNNRYLISISDVKNPLSIAMGASERRGEEDVKIDFFTAVSGPFSKYSVILRIDERKIPFDEAIMEARLWYDTIGYTAARSPKAAKQPMYSTWYSLWQTMTAKEVLRECRHAQKMGINTVIIDDGWQKARPGRIYEFVGDWCPEKKRFGNLELLSKKLHEMGMKVVLWFSVPYVGYKAKNHKRFEGKYLYELPNAHTSVLDPRYAEVREFIVNTYEEAVRKYNLDGVKLDFIDRFVSNGIVKEGMDFTSVEEATEQLLKDINRKLKNIDPDMLIEFRQPYFGPVVTAYGNMIRVWDCPLDAVMNKNSSIDLRLISSSCAVHSDMIYWSKNDTAESVATQLWSTLFAVPQISTLYSQTTPVQREVLRRYLDFWREHSDTLMSGKFSAKLCENGYGYACATGRDEKVALLSSSPIFDATDDLQDQYAVNLTGCEELVLKAKKGSVLEILDCRGKRVGATRRVRTAISEIHVPLGACLHVIRQSEK